MIVIDVLDNARQDILALRRSDKRAAAAVIAILEQLKADPQALDKLTTVGPNEVGSIRIGVKSWASMRRRANLWRFRILDTPATIYRVVYGYHWHTQQLCVLAVVRKDEFDYDDTNSDIARRILGDWDSL
jgi:hypothetical protein